MADTTKTRARQRTSGGTLFSGIASGIARVVSSAGMVGLVLALYGLGSHYVASMRAHAPFRIAAWFDVKSQLGNVFYSAWRNAGELPGHLMRADWSEVVQNLTNLAGIRTSVYVRLIGAEATNLAEWFVQRAPIGLAVMVGLRLWVAVRRGGRARIASEGLDRVLTYGAQVGLASAVCASLLLNAAGYYQDLSGVTGVFAVLGTMLSTSLDLIGAAGAGIFKELIWHLSFLVTDGKEKTVGWLLQDRTVETLTHYLANFPERKITAALHTAVYQTVVASMLWAVAHALQRRRVRRWEAEKAAAPEAGKRRGRRPAESGRRRRRRVPLPRARHKNAVSSSRR